MYWKDTLILHSHTHISNPEMIQYASTILKQIDICGITHGKGGTLNILSSSYLQQVNKIDI